MSTVQDRAEDEELTDVEFGLVTWITLGAGLLAGGLAGTWKKRILLGCLFVGPALFAAGALANAFGLSEAGHQSPNTTQHTEDDA